MAKLTEKHVVIYTISGIIASLIPINLIGSSIDNIDDFRPTIKYTPLMFASINVVIYLVTYSFNIDMTKYENHFILGVIMGLIILSIGRFIFDIPIKVFKMKNPNYFHIGGMVTWGLYYGFINQYILKTLL